MVFRGIDLKEPLCADSLCWHIDWAQFNWSQQTGRQGVTWELRKPVPGQYIFRNVLIQKGILLQMVNSNVRDSWWKMIIFQI